MDSVPLPEFKKIGSRAQNKAKPHQIVVYVKPGDTDVIKNFLELFNYIAANFPHIKLYCDEWVTKDVNELLKNDPKLYQQYD